MNDYKYSFNQMSLNDLESPSFLREVEEIRKIVEKSPSRFVLIADAGLPLEKFRQLIWKVGEALGEPLVQNQQNMRVVCVYDRDMTKTMSMGARYHQTREGGTIHTDNVNLPTLWHYLILGCLSKASCGGESILISGLDLLQKLKKDHADVLSILELPFFFEERGISDRLYQAPIVTYDETGAPHFRYLRTYLESAYVRAGTTLSDEQLYALNTLDALLESSELQQRLTLNPGEILISFDDQVFHGRTSFSDHPKSISIEELQANPSTHLPLKRTMDRLWIRRLS